MNTKLIMNNIFLFWFFFFTGFLLDKAINDYLFPKQKDKLTRIIKLQIQIMCITLLAVFLRSQVVPVSVPGNGILYAFAFMFAQDKFKTNLKKLIS